MTYPKISVIIVNFNGLKWLKNCLTSISNQSYPNYEIVLIDNNSSDNSVKYVSKEFKHIKVISISTNVGFATGNNIGYSRAKGKFIVLLNNDTSVPSNYLMDFYKAFQVIPKLGIAQSKILNMKNPNLIDSCGSFWTLSTWQYYLGYGKPVDLPIYQTPQPVFSVKGASVMISRAVLTKIGFLDDDFWCYYEETDFCHRAWIAGFQCWYWPKTYILHSIGGTSSTFPNAYIQFHNYKNKLNSFLKNLELSTLAYELPIFIIWSITISGMWLYLGKFDHIISLAKSYLWNIKILPKTLNKRRIVQETRVKTDKEIFKLTKKEPKIWYYYYLLIGRLDLYKDESIASNQSFSLQIIEKTNQERDRVIPQK